MSGIVDAYDYGMMYSNYFIFHQAGFMGIASLMKAQRTGSLPLNLSQNGDRVNLSIGDVSNQQKVVIPR
jgi:hypothetical protein